MQYLLSLLLLSTYLFAIIQEPIHTTITAINEDEEVISISPIQGAQVGMYGVIVQHFTNTHSTALSWVEITDIQADTISAKMIPIFALEQSALPTGTWTAEIGDEVVLGYNYHRALLIAPNPSVYKKVTTYHHNRKWIHPDIFTTVLSSHGHPSPLVEDFQYTCRANNIGLVSFVFDKSIVTVDCQSFKIVQNKTTSLTTDEIQLPFYTRVVNIEANWFGKGSDEMTEYSPYYISLLAENNPDNEWIQTYQKIQEKEEDSWFASWFSDSEESVEDEDATDTIEDTFEAD